MPLKSDLPQITLQKDSNDSYSCEQAVTLLYIFPQKKKKKGTHTL